MITLAYVGESDNIMKPRKDSDIIRLPITFDYNGGRKEYNKSRTFWSVILAVLGLIVGFGIILSSNGIIFVNLPLGLLVMFLVSLIIRFPIMKEHIRRNNMAQLLDSDYQITSRDFWGIYSIDSTYPYYSHLRGNRSALYVRFDKDVTLGKVSDARYEHYEAISDAYNIVGSKRVNLCHIDYMDNIGNDERLTECFKNLPNISNKDIRDVMSDVYSNLQDLMNERVSTFDVYVFVYRDSEASFWYYMQQIIACMLDGNYISFKILNSDDLRELSKSLFNLHDFSVMEAISWAFDMPEMTGVIPIKVMDGYGNETVINKTIEEKRELEKLRAQEKELKKIEKKRRKKGFKKRNPDEEIDIFEED